MLQTFFSVFEQMLRIIILLGVGFTVRKLKLFPEGTERVLSRLITLLFLPGLMLHTNLIECRVDSLIEYSDLVLYGLVFYLLSIGLAYAFSGLFAKGDNYLKRIFWYAFAFPNTGAVGMPLMIAMFGTEGLFRYNLFIFSSTVIIYSWGITKLHPSCERTGWKDSLKRVLNPTFMGMLIGMILGVLGAKDWLNPIVIETVGDLGNCYVPVALILTGYTIGSYPLSQTLGSRRVYVYTALRLLVIPCLFLLPMRLLHAPMELCVMVALTAGCSCGMNVVVFPASYGQECRTGASMLLISSVLAIFTAPLVYALAIG